MIRNSRKNKVTVSAVKPETVPAVKPAAVAVVAAEAPKPVALKATPTTTTPKVGHISLQLVKPGAKNVCVAGSFNGWKPEKTPLVQVESGRWIGNLSVQPGRHEYLFVVDGQWLPDPNAAESVQNPFGGRNSIVTVAN